MARIRSIHPTLFTDEAYMALSHAAARVLPGIWTEADDQGMFEYKPLSLKARLLPVHNDDINAILAELIANEWIKLIDVGGKKYGLCRNFRRFQRPKKPTHVHPLPQQFRSYVGLDGDDGEGDDFEGAPSSPPVPPKFPTGSELSPQMEDGGGRMEDGEEGDSARGATPPVILPVDGGSPPADADAAAKLAAERSAFLEKAAGIAMALDAWNATAERTGLPKVEKLTETRQKKFRARLEDCRRYANEHGIEGGALAVWALALSKVETSQFLRGETGKRDWTASLDFLLQESTFMRVLEGNYDDKATADKAKGSFTPTDGSPWPQRLRGYRERGTWLPMWGARPGEPGCAVPAELLKQAEAA